MRKIENPNDLPPGYPDKPQVAVGAVVFRKGRVLLVRRGRPPAQGLWAIPGGRVEMGETLQEAARREIMEESGIRIKPGDPAFIFDVIDRDDQGRVRFHYVIADLDADYEGGRIRPGDDALEARWFSPGDLQDLSMSQRTRDLLKNRYAFGKQGYGAASMRKDRLKWNARFQQGDFPSEVSPIVKDFHGLARKGRALDLAAGAGRNSVFLADRGFLVEAVDISDEGLKRIRHPRVQPVCVDLDTFEIPPERYDLILNIRYLNRRLFTHICEGLVPGGVLIFETYLEHPENAADTPSCRDYLLQANELLNAFLSLRVVFYREGPRSRPGGIRHEASLVGIKA